MSSLAGLMSMASNLESYGAERKQRQKAERIEKAVNAAGGHIGKAAEILERDYGDFMTARTLRDKEGEINRQRVEQIGTRIDEHKTILGQGGQLLKEVEAKPEVYGELRPRLIDLASQLDPRLAQEIPEQYDPQKVRGMLQFVEGGVTDLGARSQALQKLKAGYDATDDALKRDKLFRESMAHWLSTVKTPDEWTAVKQHGEAMGIPASIVNDFGDWTPDAPARASEMLLTPEQKAVAARAKIDDERQAAAEERQRAAQLSTEKHQREMERLAALAATRERGTLTDSDRARIEQTYADALNDLDTRKRGRIDPLTREAVGALSDAEYATQKRRLDEAYRKSLGGETGSASAPAPTYRKPVGGVGARSRYRETPTAVSTLLAQEPAGKFTLTDGSVWEKDAGGTIRRVQ